MVCLKVVQKITEIDASVWETIDQKTYLKKFMGASAPPLVPPVITLILLKFFCFQLLSF